MKYKNIPEMFFTQAQKYGDRVLQQYKKDGKWNDISWNQVKTIVEQVGLGLVELGVQQKEFNRPLFVGETRQM